MLVSIILLKQAVTTNIGKTEHTAQAWHTVSGGIVISAANGTAEPVAIYDTMGQLVFKVMLSVSPTHIALPKAGLYLVKTATQTLKIRITDR